MLLSTSLAVNPNPVSLVGRQHELRAAAASLQGNDVRLLTVIGPAGVGKTRFAVEVATRMTSHFADGVVAVDLTTLTDPGEFAGEVARCLGLMSSVRTSLSDQVAAYLADKDMLLVIDNAEHVLPIGAELAGWLAGSPDLRALVTSRHRLELSMEHELVLHTLPVGKDASLGPSPAAQLFIELKRDVLGEVPPGAEQLALIERLCQRVEGLPLAIELVAARLPAVSVADLRRFLADDSSTHEAVHRDVESALLREVEVSCRLVSPCAQQLFRYLAVFSGTFSLELAERQRAHARRVSRSGGGDAVLQCLMELSDHQLILPVVDAEIDAPRFRMLRMMAESGHRLLVERGELDDAREAHARAMIDYAERREYSGLRPGQEYQTVELGLNYRNLIAALGWLHDHDDDGLLQLVGGLAWFWYAQGHYRVGRSWFETILARGDVGTGLLAARFLTGHGIIADIQGDFTLARTSLLRARQLFLEIEHAFGLSYTCLTLGFCSIHLGRHDDAERYLGEALAHAANVDDRALAMTIEGLSWSNIGANHHERGSLDAAEDALSRAVNMHRRNQVLWGECRTLCDLGDIDRDRERYQLALASYQAVITPALWLGDKRLIAASFAGIATVLAHDGQMTLSAFLWGAVDALLPVVGQPSFLQVDIRAFDTGRRLARQVLGDTAFEETRLSGEQSSLDEVISLVGDLSLRRNETLEIPPAVADLLTGREQDVLQHLVVGASNRSIGRALGISERTASSHVASIFRKLNVNSRLEVVSIVIRS